jgi:hypothetical protein
MHLKLVYVRAIPSIFCEKIKFYGSNKWDLHMKTILPLVIYLSLYPVLSLPLTRAPSIC